MNAPNAAYPRIKRTVERHFQEIGLHEVDKTVAFDCKSVHGFRSLYLIRSVSHSNNVLLEIREFSYFCVDCMNRHPLGIWTNSEFVEPWILQTLEPISAGDAI
jgi:hypothetical protein